MRILIAFVAALLLVGVVMIPLRAESDSQEPVEELEYREGPVPAKYARLVEPGKCLVIRVPSDPPPRFYCP